jgi:hypothetical protein
MSQFKVNAQNVVLLNKDGKSTVLKINSEHNSDDYNYNDLVILATNSKPLIMDAIEKKTGKSNINFSDEKFLQALTQVSEGFKSSIEFLDNKLPEKKVTEKETADNKVVDNKITK